jgi:hypothetical protein
MGDLRTDQYFAAKTLMRFPWKEGHMDYSIASRTVDGLVLEFGVFQGTSLNRIASQVSSKVYGFDSFLGLPEDWILPGFYKGYFASPTLQKFPENVELVIGLFEDTLPGFVKAHPEPISLMHVDCDVYSSTKTIFRHLASQIVAGTIIMFDEYMNYPGWQNHEFKAFQEYITESGKIYEYISCSAQEQVSVRIK